MALTVGLVYNLGKETLPEDDEPPDVYDELDSEETVLAVAEALRLGGCDVVMLEGDRTVVDRLQDVRVDIVFNMSEGLRGESREAQVPAILEMLGIPYTGSGVLTLALSLDKPMAKKVFAYHRVPTPRFMVLPPGETIRTGRLRFPLFVKPAREGSSIGITPHSLVHDVGQLQRQVEYIHRFYRQPALVEEFIDGREFTVGILGNGEHRVFPVMEILFDHCPPWHRNIYSRQFKREWDADCYYSCPAFLTPGERRRVEQVAVAAFRALGCLDVGRVDIRMAPQGLPYVLEVNPLPGLKPDFSDLPRVARAGGMSYPDLVNGILDCALHRYGLTALRASYVSRSA